VWDNCAWEGVFLNQIGVFPFEIDFGERGKCCDRQFVRLHHVEDVQCILIDVFLDRRHSNLYRGRRRG
jgi:hypothetical protein